LRSSFETILIAADRTSSNWRFMTKFDGSPISKVKVFISAEPPAKLVY
jgi:hypothetical protein